MIHKQSVATLAIIAIVLAFGASTIITMIPQAHAQGGLPWDDRTVGPWQNACVRTTNQPGFCP